MRKNLQFVNGANKPKAENPIKSKRAELSVVLNDFIESRNCVSGFGIFDGIPEATQYAEKVSKNQLRKLTRQGLVPAAFIDFLVTFGIKIDNQCKQNITEGHLASMLLYGKCVCGEKEAESTDVRYIYTTEEARSAANYIAKKILTSSVPDLKKSFRLTAQYGKQN